MANKIGDLYAELSVRDRMSIGLKKAEATLSRFAATSAKIGGIAAGAGLAVFSKNAVSAASDLEETVSKSRTIFGSSAASMEAWAETAARSFGQSKEQALGAAATMGNLFVGAMGLAQSEAATMSKQMVMLAADLASFNNTEPDEAILAIGAALRGESEPIRRFGVLLNDATLKAKAFAMGIYDGKGTLDPTSKALAAYQVILDQTKTAQGDFARTSGGLANSQRTLSALWKDLSADIGEGLLPVVTSFVDKLKEIPFEQISQMGKDLAGEAGGAMREIAIHGGIIKGWFDEINPLVYITRDLVEDWANQSRRIADDATFFRDFAPGQMQNFVEAEQIIEPTDPRAEERLRQVPSYLLRGADKRARSFSDIKTAHDQEMAILKARQAGDIKEIKRLEEKFRIQARIKELVDKEIDEREAAMIAEAEAQQRAATDAAIKARDKKNDDRLELLDAVSSNMKVAEVNSMQARGLGMGAMDVPSVTKNTRDLVKQITEQLRELLTRDPEEGVF